MIPSHKDDLLPRPKRRHVLLPSELKNIKRLNEPQGGPILLCWNSGTWFVPPQRYCTLLASLPPVTKGLNKAESPSLFPLRFFQPEKLSVSPKCSDDLLEKLEAPNEFAEFQTAIVWDRPTQKEEKGEYPVDYKPGFEIRESYPELCSLPLLQDRLDSAGFKYRATQEDADQPIVRGRRNIASQFYRGEPRPLGCEDISTPYPCTQKEPTPLKWDAAVNNPPAQSPAEYYSEARNLEIASFAAQKELSQHWLKQAKDSESQSVDLLESDPRCAKCGGGSFTEDDICVNCKAFNWQLRKQKKKSISEERETAESGDVPQDSLSGMGLHTRKPRRGRGKKDVLTADEIVMGILSAHVEGLGWYVAELKRWEDLARVFQVLIGEKLPTDIANETGEKLRAVEARIEKIRAAIRDINAQEDKPRLHDIEKHVLLHILGIRPDDVEPIPGLRVQPLRPAVLPARIRRPSNLS